jgi:hypothetical protein
MLLSYSGVGCKTRCFQLCFGFATACRAKLLLLFLQFLCYHYQAYPAAAAGLQAARQACLAL